MQLSEPQRTSSPRSADRLKRCLPLLFLLALIVFACGLRVWAKDKPFTKDSAALAVMGQEMLVGRPLYSDLVEIRPPVAMIMFELANLFQHGERSVVLVFVVSTIVILLGLYSGGSQGDGGAIGGLFAVAFWVVLSNCGDLQAGDPDTEVFINMFQIWAFVMLVRINSASSWQNVFAAAAFFILASFSKHLSLIAPMLLVPTYALLSDGHNLRSKRIKQAVVILLLIGGAWFCLFGYFALTGRFSIFRDLLISNALDYAASSGVISNERAGVAGVLLRNALAPFYGKAEFVADALNPLLLLSVIGIVIGLIRKHSKWVLLSVFLFATWLEVSLGGQFYPHYYQLWVPPLAIGASWTITELRSLFARWRVSWVPQLAGLAVLVFLFVSQYSWYRMDFQRQWTGLSTADMDLARPLATEIQTLLRPEESFYQYGSNSQFYLFANRPPPTGVLWAKLLLGGSLRGALSQRVVEDLKRTRPELIVAEKVWVVGNESNEVLKMVLSDYRPFPKNAERGPFVLYVRRGGALESRLESASGETQTANKIVKSL